MKTTNSSSQPIPLHALHGVGPSRAKRLAELGLATTTDLVHDIPRDYEDRSTIRTVAHVHAGEKNTVRGHICNVQLRRAWSRQRMTIIEGRIEDETGSILVIWFNQPYLTKQLLPDAEYILTGLVKSTTRGLQMQSPICEKVDSHKTPTHTGRIVPLYSLTAGITQNQMRYFVTQALERSLPVTDYLPSVIIKEFHLLPRSVALRALHFPQSMEELFTAKRRWDFDKLYILKLLNILSRKSFRTQHAPALSTQTDEIKTFVARLPFQLTNAQRKCAWAILQEMERPFPMNRLLSGDVGSGKTVVAAIAILNTVLHDYQAVVLVPTAILAQQHFQTLTHFFQQTPYRISLCTSATKKEMLRDAEIIVGTHALLEDDIAFRNLGLAVIDEQHRFGVEQRKRLKERSGITNMMPHLLSMTATPIPRTLALALFGDLDLSMMEEMPKNRKPILTRVVPPQKRKDAYQFLREHMDRKEQIFVICPLISESEIIEAKSVEKEFEHLSKNIFPQYRVAMLHGKMKQQEKDDIMRRMQQDQIDMLVATSVVEVGVDVPHATVMVIESAERFGLAQLHQLRGRVGRNNQQSYCFFFSDSGARKTLDRLAVLVKSHNGFELAEKDLAIRGAGTMYGTIQSGFGDYALELFRQPQLISDAQKAAKQTIEKNMLTESPLLRKELEKRLDAIHLE